MGSIDLMMAEVLEEIASSDESNEQQQEVIYAFNTDIYGMGHKLKMIAWDRQ